MNKKANMMAVIAMTSTLSALAGEDQQAETPMVAEPTSWIDSINSKGYGTFSGRVQLLSMYRDYETTHGHNTTLGAMLGYVSPTWQGFSLGATYNYAGTLFDGGNTNLLANDDIHLLNEAWIGYQAGALGLEETSLIVGRQIVNGEVFRKDDFRQKARGVEAAQLIVKEVENLTFSAGHAIRMSNWIALDDRWDYNDFGDVFNTGYDTDGITWGEVSYTGLKDWSISLYDGYAWDVANLFGTRIQYDVCDEVSLIGYYRNETNVGDADSRHSDAWGLSIQQQLDNVKLEGGYFGVHGNNMLFNEVTTGFNHALGASMMIFGKQYNGGADTAYLKATTKMNNTVLYGLYNYTWQDHERFPFNAQELNVVVKQIITDDFAVCLKAGVAHCDGKKGTDDLTATDTRLFVTYTF
ncbi:outer membrane porin, OprD family [Verrucomicrobiaceae bacterium N1E253]|uniref:Outer membrane porin, OprD family n=1 Tax=Oceaniferula marina TaxID=2748318 RepID=A0A851GEI6_9BACT|nr:OprD family outer membrane porin [Oceaniferula marina]NWK56168.1 outer membrane porin, OprD family [Oceaniferula marina]